MTRMTGLLCFFLSLSVILPASAQQLVQHHPQYRLERNDVLEIKYRYTPEFDQTITVGPDGYVSLEGIGDMVAAGLTMTEFHDTLVKRSSERLENPVVTISLKEFDKPHVYVEGEVNTPGKVELRSDLCLTDAIAMAGGFKSSAKQSEVLLLQHPDGIHGATRVVNVKKLIASKHLEEAIQLSPGDVIYVQPNGLSKIESYARLGQFGAIYSPVR